MADDNNSQNGSKDRATVALVDAKVDGLKDLIRAEFATVKEDVKALASVVSDVIKQGVILDDHEKRLEKIENEKISERTYRRENLPVIVFTCIATVIAIVTLLTQMLHG